MWPTAALQALAREGELEGFALTQGVTNALYGQEDADIDIDWYVYDRDSDQYGLSTAAQVRGLAALVNGQATHPETSEPIGAVSFAGKTITLVGNVNLAPADDVADFTPIGTPDAPFAGTFDGNGFTVTNLRMSSQLAYAGLFGYASAESTIMNVTLSAGPRGGISASTETDYVGYVGTLAGVADGRVEDCSSDVPVSIESRTQATAELPYVVQYVGGLVGLARADVAGCSYAGTLDAEIYADPVSPDTEAESLRVADSFGGVVGRFGDPAQHGTLTDSHNLGDVIVQTYGTGDTDRFGTATNSVAFFVGGVAGYSNGSVLRCYNGAYNSDTMEVTGSVLTGRQDANDKWINNRGGDQVGGIVGSLRGESDDPNRFNDGDPDDPMVVSDCYNEAQVSGLVAVGGIAGQTGTYCTIMRCYNGTITDLSDWQRNQIAGKVVTTRWNKPLSGGIVGQCRSGVVSYCANYAEVRNVQTGYYMAGIIGGLFASDDYPNVTGEIYACFNSGGIYTVNESKNVEYREAGICGDNEGYVHDCIVMKGSVPYHGDSAIGNMDWGMTGNLYVKTPAELRSPESAALLNSIASQNQDWTCYWFINRVGYPVLNTWAALDDSQRILLTADSIVSATQVSPAPYVGAEAQSVPQLAVTVKGEDGSEVRLIQDTDFRVIPQPGAHDISAEPVYKAGIEGIGLYRGTVADCAAYSIGAADLGSSTLQISAMKYQFGHVVFPTSVKAVIAGATIDSSAFDYVIYNNATTASAVTGGGNVYPVFDSRGYVSFDADGAVKTPVSEVGVEALNASTEPWWLYDRDGLLISDSEGNSYYTFGNVGAVFRANSSCVNLKSGTPAGYVVQASAPAGSAALTGTTVGYYVIEPVDLYRGCTFHSAEWNGETWMWDADQSRFYYIDALGQRLEGAVSATFTGQTIEPKANITCGEHTLVQGVDFRIIPGDPNPSEAGVETDEEMPNRNVTDESTRSAITIYPQNTANLSNYVIAYFNIAPADFADCTVVLTRDEWAYTGEEVRPDIEVSLAGVKLVEGLDYDITFSDNVEKGLAHYTVTPRANLSGGSMEPVTGTFEIVDGVDLASLVTGEVADQPFNFGADVHPALTFFEDEARAVPVELIEGADYTVSYSTRNVTKWSDADRKEACVATVTGRGIYTGSVEVPFDIVPYDATANATGQLRADVQDMAYGTWGTPSTANVVIDDEQLPFAPSANLGPSYPVIAVRAFPIVDWAAYDAGELDSCYGEPLVMATSNNNNYGGVLNRYPVRYYDADGVEVNGNGAVYTNTDRSLLARPAKAKPGPMTAQIWMRCGTSGARNGAVGHLDVAFDYTAPADLSTVSWKLADGTNPMYDGASQKPIVGTLAGTGEQLVEGVDYTIAYADNVEVGTASYTATAVEGEGALFAGSYTGKFSIMPCDVSKADDIRVTLPSFVALEGGVAQPTVTVSRGDATLVEGVDYTLSYLDNRQVGQASVYVSGIGNYTGARGEAFAVVNASELPFDISGGTMTGLVNVTDATDASAQVPVVSAGGLELREGVDYTLSYLRDGAVTDDFTSPGVITVVATGIGACKGSVSGTYAVNLIDLGEVAFALDADSFVYDGAAKMPAAKLSHDGVTLEEGRDYTLAYSGNVNAGTARVTATGIGRFTGTAVRSFTIKPVSIGAASLGTLAAQTYTGSELRPTPAVKLGGNTLVAGTDYTLGYANNVNAGIATVTATGKGNYAGVAKTTFVIAPRSLAGAQIAAVATQTFTGKAIAPAPAVKLGGKTLVAGTDYKLAYAGNVNVGSATITATGAGNYTGTVSTKFTIAKAAQPLTVKAKSKKLTVKAKALAKKAQTFKKAKVFTVKGAKGAVTFKVASYDKKAKKKITVSKAGKLTVKKGLGKGTYTLKVKVSAKATANYKQAVKAVKVKVVVK